MKKTICVILCAALTLVMLTACSSKKEVSEPMPTPDPTATPSAAEATATAATVSSAPSVTKSPTDESIQEGGSCSFIAKADNATSVVWRFVSPDGRTDEDYSSVYGYFPYLSMSGGTEETLRLSNAPSDLNGWRVYCRFSNGTGSVDSSSATITVTAAAPAPDTTNDGIDHSIDYSGVYYETATGHGIMNISGSPDHYDISVEWSFNPGENTCWTFSGTFDSSGSLNFSDCAKVTTTYYENGEIQDSTTEYAWASGSLSITGAAGFVWNIPQDSAVSGSVFEQVG